MHAAQEDSRGDDMNPSSQSLVFATSPAALVVSAALQRLPPSLELAGLNLGASRLTCFRRITLPLIAPSVLAGSVFAFLASFDETVVSFFISGTEHKTVTRKMFEDIEYSLSPVIAAASTVFIAVTLVMMVLANSARRAGERGAP